MCSLRIHVYYFHPVLMCASAYGFYSVCRGLADQRHQPMLKVLIPKPNKDYSKMASSLTWRKMSCEETWDESIPPPQRVCGSVWRGPVLYVFHSAAIDNEAEGYHLSQSCKTAPQHGAHEICLIYISYETTLTLCGCQHK